MLFSYSEFKALNEAKAIEDPLTSSLKEYGKVSKELTKLYDSIKEQTDKLEKEKSELFDKILSEMETSQKNLVAADGVIAEIKIVKGKSRTNPKYKEAFSLALTKVNDAIKNILNEALKANTTFTEAVDKKQLDIRLSENVLTDAWKKVKNFFVEIYKNIKLAVSDQTKAVKELEKISKQFELAVNESKFSNVGELLDFLGGKDALVRVEILSSDEGINSKEYAVNIDDLKEEDRNETSAFFSDEDGETFEIEISDISEVTTI